MNDLGQQHNAMEFSYPIYNETLHNIKLLRTTYVAIYIYSIVIIKYGTTLIVGSVRKLYGFEKILHFKNQPCNRLYPEKPSGMHT